MRAYTNAYAYAQNPAAIIRRASDNATQTIGLLPSGQFDSATASNFCTSTSCFVQQLYDQTGNGNDLSTTTTANQPQLVFNCLGT